MNNKTRTMVLNSLMIALVCISTMAIQIPTPGTNGYVNVGDSIIFVSSILFGPTTGMIAGGIGSALADILSGYTHWALFTLIIKGLEGYIVGIIIKNNQTLFKNIIATIIGSVVMVIGYYIGGGILEGSFIASLSSIPSNTIQGIFSVIIGVSIAYSLGKVKYIQSFIAKDN